MKWRVFKTILIFTILTLTIHRTGREVTANIFQSPHNLVGQGYLLIDRNLVETERLCSTCHFSPRDDRPLIWGRTPDSLGNFGSIGNLCASCHDGVSMVDRSVDSALTSFHPESHGLDPAKAPENTDLSVSGFNFQPGDLIKCTTCHDPHDNSRRPFLRAELSKFCDRCHVDRRNDGFGSKNATGNHPVGIEPFDNTEGASPISIQGEFMVFFPEPYPAEDGIYSPASHWKVGGHLTFGSYGRIECYTCHALHGHEENGALPELLAKDPVKYEANEFCEGCHRGERGDDRDEPPYPNPGGTTVGRTYHPVDDDEANGAGWLVAIADTTELNQYEWGHTDEEGFPYILCTTCHQAHGGMENSPALVPIDDEIQDEGTYTFCETCHRDPPPDHHGYENNGEIRPDMAELILLDQGNLGHTYGNPVPNRIYCSYCHVAHNAGYDRREEQYIPILVDKGTSICESCHQLGVSHFMGDPVLPSTYGKDNPSIFRGTWPSTEKESFYEGKGQYPTGVTCLSCHYLGPNPEESGFGSYRLLAPADIDTQWTNESQEDYLCTGCHGEDPTTAGEGHTHPLMNAESWKFRDIFIGHLLPDEFPVTYTAYGNMNCHSCHMTHNAVIGGGVFILKVVRGDNVDPRAIQPDINFTALCHSCHPSEAY